MTSSVDPLLRNGETSLLIAPTTELHFQQFSAETPTVKLYVLSKAVLESRTDHSQYPVRVHQGTQAVVLKGSDVRDFDGVVELHVTPAWEFFVEEDANDDDVVNVFILNESLFKRWSLNQFLWNVTMRQMLAVGVLVAIVFFTFIILPRMRSRKTPSTTSLTKEEPDDRAGDSSHKPMNPL